MAETAGNNPHSTVAQLLKDIEKLRKSEEDLILYNCQYRYAHAAVRERLAGICDKARVALLDAQVVVRNRVNRGMKGEDPPKPYPPLKLPGSYAVDEPISKFELILNQLSLDPKIPPPPSPTASPSGIIPQPKSTDQSIILVQPVITSLVRSITQPNPKVKARLLGDKELLARIKRARDEEALRAAAALYESDSDIEEIPGTQWNRHSMSASRIPPNMNQLQNTLKPKTYLPPPPLIPNKRRYREDQTILSGGEEPLAGPSKIQRTDSVASQTSASSVSRSVSGIYE